jgi:hypothetical protein
MPYSHNGMDAFVPPDAAARHRRAGRLTPRGAAGGRYSAPPHLWFVTHW